MTTVAQPRPAAPAAHGRIALTGAIGSGIHPRLIAAIASRVRLHASEPLTGPR